MAGWSPEIANEFIRLGATNGRAFDQSQLQKLVYIAHGWCLAISRQPLTGDRPEAWSFGPVYRKLAGCLEYAGLAPITREITVGSLYPEVSLVEPSSPAKADLDSFERDVIARTFDDYGGFEAWQLSALTRKHKTAPWSGVYAGGAGEFREISHRLIEAQFVGLVKDSGAA